MTLSRKDYIKIASILSKVNSKARNESEYMIVRRIAEGLATYMKLDNSAFDTRRFLLACGVDTENTEGISVSKRIFKVDNLFDTRDY
jgi:hypothetical protein